MKRILIDFDGTLHEFNNGYGTGEINGKPIEGAIRAVNKLIEQGFEIIVFTARKEKEFQDIKEWLRLNGFPALKVTDLKLQALAYIDDRGIRFEGNWDNIIKFFV